MNHHEMIQHSFIEESRLRRWIVWALASMACLTSAAAGADAVPGKSGSTMLAEGVDANGSIQLLVNKSRPLSTQRPYKRVSVAQPDVADVNTIGPSNLLVTAKKPGSTQLIIWDETERTQVIDVTVSPDVAALQDQLKTVFPELKIEASVGGGQLVLRGRVPSAQVAEQAVALATPYAPKILNLLEVAGGQQVLLQVRFAEVSRNTKENLGFNAFGSDGHTNIGFLNGPGGTPIGGVVAGGATTINPAVAIFGRGEIGNFAFEYFIQALRDNSLLRILAEPNLIAISGQEASFLAGGEFPVPVPQSGSGGGTTITVEYREFGVKLAFVPVVLGDGRIRLKVTPEVSDLDYTTAVQFEGFVTPGLTKRRVNTTIELNEGQTFAIAGLLNSNYSASKSVTPLLGDVPVLGALFRSVRYQRKETELVVLVTPKLVGAMNPGQVPTLPGEHWRFPTEGGLLLDRDLGGPADAPPKFQGEYGFRPTTQPSSGGK